ncbi:hypothetical protein CJU90_6637 [Yarrowia sp. C11]|nr:hypothetical protein CJU90_6637 [Yarrowia sp. C11]KAG5358745.1 hypothetical protein CKK34_5016 [Yarrowia sp. E02]
MPTTLNDLPVEIVRILAQHVPSTVLRGVNKRLFLFVDVVYEDLSRARYAQLGNSVCCPAIRSYHNHICNRNHEDGSRIWKPESEDAFPEGSWFFIYHFMLRDVHYFDAQTIQRSSELEREKCDYYDELSDFPAAGTWKYFTKPNGCPGLFAANVHWIEIRYEAYLASGVYDVFLNLRTTDFQSLQPLCYLAIEVTPPQDAMVRRPPMSDLSSLGMLPEEKTNNNQNLILNLGRVSVPETADKKWNRLCVGITDLSNSIKRRLIFNSLQFRAVLDNQQKRAIKPSEYIEETDDSHTWWSVDRTTVEEEGLMWAAYKELNELKHDYVKKEAA